MNCEFYKQQFGLLLTGSLDESQRKVLEDHLSGCPDCQAEFEISKKLWEMMGEIPHPVSSSRMRTGFNTLLESYKQETMPEQKKTGSSRAAWKEMFRFRPAYRIALAVLLVIAALRAFYKRK